MRIDVNLRGVVVGLFQVDKDALDGADTARLELLEDKRQEDKRHLELVREARDVRRTSVEIALIRAASSLNGTRRYVNSVVMSNPLEVGDRVASFVAVGRGRTPPR